MIFEVASITVKEGCASDFEDGVAKATSLFERAKGCHEMRLERSIEAPLRYRLIVGWDTVNDHMIEFRNSGDFQIWRSLVSHTFSEPPFVEHMEVALAGFAKPRKNV